MRSTFHYILILALVGAIGITSITPISAQAQDSAGSSGAAPAAIEAIGSAMAGPGEGLEAAISAEEYRLGPGDGLTIVIWAPQPVRFDLLINLEGKLLIPNIGEIPIDGLLLEEARRQVIQSILRQYHNVEVTVSLSRLRKFQVHVLGQIEKPGTYLGTAVDRVSAAVAWAGGLLETASHRQIQVLSADTVRTYADLFIFLQRGIPGSNPWLRDGDIVYVPYSQDRFSVQGAVNQPDNFEFLPGDRFSEGISFAGGFRPEAFRDTIEIARYLGPERHPVRFFALSGGDLIPAQPQYAAFLPKKTGTFNIDSSFGDEHQTVIYPDFDLKSDDIIFIRSVPEERVKQLVEIKGEVSFPGFYAIVEGKTYLSDIIQRAGGITPEAFLAEANLIRRETIRLEDKEFERLKAVPAADMTENEYEYFKLRSRENPGLMVIDFHKLLVLGESESDILLRRGDLIEIPTQRDFVSVLGMVRSPGNILYNEGFSPADYIKEAKGYAEEADRGNAKVIRAAGGEWISLKDVDKIESGDTIWIPEKPEHNFWEIFKDIVGVTTEIVTIYLVVDTAINR